MLRQQTEQLKSRLDGVSGLGGLATLGDSGPLSRGIIWVIACALILGGTAYMTSGSSGQLLVPLFGGRPLQEHELDQFEMAFSDAELTGWKRDDANRRMLVPQQSKNAFLAALKDSPALPFVFDSSTESTLRNTSILQSESQKRIQYQIAKASDLGKKIAAFDGIALASVVYDERDGGGFGQPAVQSASVAVLPADGKALAPSMIEMIQDYVSGSYAGMTADQVTVTDTSARKTYNGVEDSVTRKRRHAEYELQQRLSELLGGFRGIHIAVTSVLPQHTPSPNEADDFSMRVSIGLPENQFHNQWIHDYRSQHPDADAVPAPSKEQLASIRDRVNENIRQAIMPIVSPTLEAESQSIRIWSYPDPEHRVAYHQDTNTSEIWREVVAIVRANKLALLPIGCVLLLGMVLAVAALRMRLRSPPATVVESVPNEEVRVATGGDRSIKPAPEDESSLRDDLAELVESNPELAAQIVHSWMSDAA